jgi:hypothetical protein
MSKAFPLHKSPPQAATERIQTTSPVPPCSTFLLNDRRTFCNDALKKKRERLAMKKDTITAHNSRDWLIQVGTNHHSPERYANVLQGRNSGKC